MAFHYFSYRNNLIAYCDDGGQRLPSSQYKNTMKTFSVSCTKQTLPETLEMLNAFQEFHEALEKVQESSEQVNNLIAKLQ